jgi:hypothetical protein
LHVLTCVEERAHVACGCGLAMMVREIELGDPRFRRSLIRSLNGLRHQSAETVCQLPIDGLPKCEISG